MSSEDDLRPQTRRHSGATPAIMIDTAPTVEFPAVRFKKIAAAFDGGRVSSTAAGTLPAEIERRIGIADRLAAFVPDRRAPSPLRSSLRK